jgi:hypothetical protein
MEDLERRLRDLEGRVKGFRFEDLWQNEKFVSAALTATQAALKIHQQEKLDALKNAVINAALGKQPDANRQQQFIALVDRFSETHLVVLKFLNDPEGYFQRQGKSAPWIVQNGPKLLVNNPIQEAMPRLRTILPEDHEATAFQFIELILGDLFSTRLVTLDRLNDTWGVPAFSSRPGGTSVQKMIVAATSLPTSGTTSGMSDSHAFTRPDLSFP